VTLDWQPPTENTNGTPLTNLAGYYIYYGTQSQNYTNTIQITNPGVTTYVVENLSPGTYYFVIAAYNSAGEDSADSAQVTTTVQ
jgi:Fibronectin type III domain